MLWHLDTTASTTLHEQLAASVRRALTEGSLSVGDPLPPARELAEVVDVHANTVLQAYRTLRSEGLLEFRRGRGVRVSGRASGLAPVTDAARSLLAVGRRHGYTTDELAALLIDLDAGAPA